MLNEIHCDTEISELLQISEVEEYLNNSTESLNNYIKEIKSTLDNQMTLGGLSTKAFEIDGDPLLNSAANKTLEQVEELEQTYDSLRKSALSYAEEQRKQELTKLKIKIFDKILEINAKISSTRSIIMDIKSVVNPGSVTEYQNKLDLLSTEKEKYTTKYEEVSSLI